jgi:arylsulfatase A-like enzyme
MRRPSLASMAVLFAFLAAGDRFGQCADRGPGSGGNPSAAIAAASHRPNVLFLFTDDQRKDTIHALGNPHIKTPNLDKLVESGLTFQNAYCMGGNNAAVCLPSRQMLLSGLSWFAVKKADLTKVPNFPTSLNAAGYLTYHIGKKGNTPENVQKFFTENHYIQEAVSRQQGRPGEAVADGAVDFLRRWDKQKPFCMYVAFETPHDPRQAPPEYLAQYDPAKIPAPPNFLPFHPFDNGELTIRDEKLAPWPRGKEDIQGHLRDYYAVITFMDGQIGRILEALGKTGQYDNTIIIFSSDQGIAIGSHGLMGKQNLYEHSMGVPLVFCGPGIPKGKVSDTLCYLFDVYPTVCDLVGAKIPATLEGRSLAPILAGRTDRVRDTVFLAYKDVQRAVRDDRWKLIVYPQVHVAQLFDLKTDPYETKNLAADPTYADRIKRLTALMEEQQKLFGDTQPLRAEKPGPAAIDLDFFKQPPAKKAVPKIFPRVL